MKLWEWNGYRKAVPDGYQHHHSLLVCFARAKPGKDKFIFWKGLIEAHYPEPTFIWDRWSDLFFAACCGYKELIDELTGVKIQADHDWWRYVMATGSASSGKTKRVAMWLFFNWLADQSITSCVLTSTSIDQLKRRTWSEVLWCVTSSSIGFPKGVLEVVSSDTLIREPTRDNPADTKSAIFGRAVDQGGSTQNAVDRIKGVHNRNMFVAIDEMTSMPEAITKACRNLKKGTKIFQLFGIANAGSHDDQHGQYCEPEMGWGSISVDDEFWLTSKGGCCVHFDSYKSPALKEPDRFHFYPNQKDIDEDIAFFGGENAPEFWSESRGFWPPTGLSNTVMDSALLAQFKVSEPAVWKSQWEMCAFLDPAFEGGDRRVLYPFKLGTFASGEQGIEYQEPIIVAVDTKVDTRWIHYLIADAVKLHCEQYVDQTSGEKSPILPGNFMMDTTGEGGGLFSILSGRWSAEIQACEFGGAADETQVHPDRPTTYYELYANRVTMLWYVLRRLIEGNQIRGLSHSETKKELCSREKDKPRGGKTAVLSKKKMKGLRSRSPDLADACVGGAEFLRKRGIAYSGSTGAQNIITPKIWNMHARRMNMTSEEGDYSDAGANF